MVTAVGQAEQEAGLRPAQVEWRLVWCGTQVLVSHCLASVLAEYVFTQDGFTFPGVFGIVESLGLAIAPLLWRAMSKGPRAALHLLLATQGDELVLFATCGLAMAVSHGAGLAANVRINYTTATLFSSARLPSVLLVGAVMHQAKHTPPTAHLAAVCVMIGLTIFGLAERMSSPRFSVIGLALVALNLVLGAFTFNLQQRILHAVGRSRGGAAKLHDKDQFMVVQYFTGACLYLAYCVASGEAQDFEVWCENRGTRPGGEMAPVLGSALLAAIGVRALLTVTSEFDAARASVLTSTRKVCTFVLSFLIFPKPVTSLHVMGVVLTMVGSLWVHRALERKGGGRCWPSRRSKPQQRPTLVQQASAE